MWKFLLPAAAASNICKRIRPAGCTQDWLIYQLGIFSLPINGLNPGRFLMNLLKFELCMADLNQADPLTVQCVRTEWIIKTISFLFSGQKYTLTFIAFFHLNTFNRKRQCFFYMIAQINAQWQKKSPDKPSFFQNKSQYFFFLCYIRKDSLWAKPIKKQSSKFGISLKLTRYRM